MKSLLQHLSFLFALSLSLLPAALPAATSDPVGAMTVTVPAGFSIVATPFVNSPLYVGSFEGLSGNSVSVSNLTAGAYDSLHFIEVTNDTDPSDGIDTEGLIIDVVSNDGGSITLAGDLSGVVGNESFVLRQHVTLEDLFADASGLSPYSDTFTFYQDGLTKAYTTDGAGNWVDLSSFASVSNVIVYPGNGFVCGLQSSVTLTFFGAVKMTPTQIPVYGNSVVNIVSFLNPAAPQNIEDIDLDSLQQFSDSFTKYTSDGSLAVEGAYTYGSGAIYDLSTFAVSSVSSESTSALVFILPTNDSLLKTPGISISQ